MRHIVGLERNGGFWSHRNDAGVKKGPNPSAHKSQSVNLVKDIRRATRKHYLAEEKIRIVLDGLRGESSIAELCRREGIAESLYYSWSKVFLEAGKRRLAGERSAPPPALR